MSKNNLNNTKEVIIKEYSNALVIGGNEIYKLFMNDISTWYVTTFKCSCKNIDVFLDLEIQKHLESIPNSEVIYEDDSLIITKYSKI